jgi:TPR repeat protein
VPQDVVQGRRFIQRQIDLGDPVGLLYFAKIAENGIAGPVDLVEAYRFYTMAAAHGITAALMRMARMMMLGQGVVPSVAGARELYNTMIERDGNADAMTQLGLHYLRGEGVEKDIAKAEELIRRAAGLGNPGAQELLPMLARGPLSIVRRFLRRGKHKN